MIETGDGAVVHAPDPNPMVVLARGGSQAALLPRLCDDVVWDIFLYYTREQRERPTRMGASLLDILRADLARRHGPQTREPVCVRCLCAWDEHDEVFGSCPDDERFRACA